MAVYTADRIMQDVRVALDRNRLTGSLVTYDVHTLTLDQRLRHLIARATKQVAATAPVELLARASHPLDQWMDEGEAQTGIEWHGANPSWWGRVLLPPDFFRLVCFKMEDWLRTVWGNITESDPQYPLQRSPIAGVRGTPRKPVVAIVHGEQGLELEFYSCKYNTMRIERALYLPVPQFDKDGGIEIAPRLYDATIYTIGAQLASENGDADRAAILNELAKAIEQ